MHDSAATPGEPIAAKRLTARERRDGILDAAAIEFSTMGYQGATIARIARTAGCSEPNLYKHFKDKRDLLFCCLQHLEQHVERDLDALVLEPDVLERFLHFVDHSLEYRRMLQLRMLCSTLPDDEELLEHLRQGTERLLARFNAGLERGKATGTIAVSADSEHAAWTWLGLSLAACYGGALDGEQRFADVMDIAKRTLLDAVAAKPPAAS